MRRNIIWKHLMSRRWTILRTELFTKGYIVPLKNYIGIPNKELLVTKESETSSLYNSLDGIKKISLALLKKIQNDNDYGLKVYKDCIESCENLVKVSKDVSMGNLRFVSLPHLANRLNSYLETYLNFTPFLVLPPNYEMHVIGEINKRLVEKVGFCRSEEYLKKLMSPQEYPFQVLEQIDLAKIALKLKTKNKLNITKALKAHQHKYQWLSCYNIDEAEFSLEDFKKRLAVLHELSFSELKKKTESLDKKLKRDENEFQRVISKLSPSNELLNKIKLLREFVFLRTYRIEMNSQSNFYVQPLFREISKRGKIPIRQLTMMLSNEIKLMLTNGQVPDSVNFKDREEYAVFWLDDAKYHHAFGNQARAIISKQILDLKQDNQVDTLKGTTASLGHTIIGKVRLLNKDNISEFIRGEVLVTTMTSPEFVPAMHKAAAIVTDEGGVLCHAAIVAREMKIPCLIYSKIATKILRNGDLVEVNTKDGYIKIIKRQ